MMSTEGVEIYEKTQKPALRSKTQNRTNRWPPYEKNMGLFLSAIMLKSSLSRSSLINVSNFAGKFSSHTNVSIVKFYS